MSQQLPPTEGAKAELELATMLVRLICLAMLLPIGINLLRAVVYPELAPRLVAISFWLGLGTALAFLGSQSGRPRLGGAIMVALVTATLLVSAFFDAGIRSPAYIGLLSVAFLSVWLVGIWGAALIIVVSVFGGLWLMAAQQSGLGGALNEFPDTLFWHSIISQMVLSVLLQWGLLKQLRGANAKRLHSEEGYRALFDHAADAIFAADPTTGIIRDANLKAQTLVGRPLSDLLTMHQLDLHPPEQRAQALEAFKRASTTPGGREEGLALLHADGHHIPVEIATSVVTTADGDRMILGIFRDVSERRRAEDALRASEERFRVTFEQAAVGMTHYAADGRFLLINRRFCEIVGYSEAELKAITFRELTHPDDLSTDESFARRLMAGEIATYTLEKRYLRKDGVIIWVNLTVSPISSPSGAIEQVLGVIEEITDRKVAEWALRQLNTTLEERVGERTLALSAANGRLQAEVAVRRQVELALRESEARFRRLADNAPDIIYRFEYEPTPRFTYVSPAFETITGYTPDECYADPWINYRLLYPDDRPLLKRALSDPEALRGPLELRWVHRSGEVIWIEQRNVPLFNDEGKIVVIEGITRDVTERKRTLEALLQSEARYRELLESLRQGVVVFQEQGVSFCNSALANILGYNVEYLLTCSIDELMALIHREDRERLIGNTSSSLQEGFISSDEPFRFYRAVDGAVRWIHSASRVISYGGRPAILGVLNDITDLKSTEEALRQSRDELRAANLELAHAARLKDEFLANMSHELRTPLNAILGRAELLAEAIHGPLNERQLRSVTSIEESGRHLLELINDILDLSKIEANKLELQQELVSVSDLCEASLRLVAATATKKGIGLSSEVDPQIVMVVGDPRRLKQILVNLLANAVKFTPAGGKVGLEARADEPAGCATFTVWDTGIGIASDDLPRLFRPFEQLDSKLSRQYEGTGLGLSLVARLARLHDGTVTVESEPGRGSRFTVTLPWRPREG